MKKLKAIMAATLCLMMVFGFAACGGNAYDGVKVEEYIDLAEYKGLEVKSFKVKITDKEVEEEIESRLHEKATTEERKDGTVKDGDTITIDYEGKIDGKTFDGGSAEDASLTIGSGQFIDGFEKGLIDVKVGDSKKLKLKFPDDYSNSDVAGKDVTFDVTVKSKQVEVVPELDEDFVKDNSDAKTVKEYKKLVKDELKAQKKESAIQEQKDYLWNEVVSNSSVKKDDDDKEKYPETQLDDTIARYTEVYENYAKQSNMELSEFLEEQMGMDEKTFKKQIKEQAKAVVKEDMIVYYIANKEDISVSNDEYDKFVEDTLKSYGYDEAQYKEATGQTFEEANGGKEVLMTYVCKTKVLDFLLDNAKVVDKLSKEKDKDNDK